MKIKYQILLLPSVFLLGACSGDDLEVPAGKMGSVSLVGVEVSNASEVINSAGGSRAVTDVSNYIVEFYRQGEADPMHTYVYADMPGTVELPEGVYTASVRSHDLQKAEFERPYFQGSSAEFSVTAGEITEVDPIKCTFKSLKVSIVFDSRLQENMGSDVKVTVVANDEGKLEFTPANNPAGYFATIDGSVTLVATFTGTVNGHYENFFTTYTDVAAGQHRIITYKLDNTLPKPDQPSGSIDGNGISVDVSYEDVDLTGNVDPGKEEPLPDDDDPGKLPEIPSGGDGEEPGPGGDDPNKPDVPPASDPITFGGTLENGGTYSSTALSQYLVKIHADKGCKDIFVEIDSPFLDEDMLSSVGLTTKFSLLDATYAEAFESLSLPYGGQVLDKTDIDFDITGFMDLLAIGGESANKFTIKVTDAEGNVQNISFTITVAA